MVRPAIARRLGVLLLALPLAVASAPPCRAQDSAAEKVQQAVGAATAPTQGQPAQPDGRAGDEAGSEVPAALEFSGDPLSARAWKRYGRQLVDAAIGFVPDVVRALIVLVVFWVLYRIAAGVFRSALRRTKADPSVLSIGTRLLRYVLFAFAVVMAASELGFNVGSILAGISILGLAVGLAAQESLGNVVAGLTILFDRPYRVGDNVTIAGTFGQVKEISLRTTRILTVERLDAIVPNREIVKQEIVNHTLNPQLRLGVPLSVAYKEDTREARRVLLAAVEGHRLILDEPAPAVVVQELADSGVDLELRVWLRDPYTEREALFEMTELAKIALDEAGIEIPFPQLTLHAGTGTFGVRRVDAPERPVAQGDDPGE